MSGPSVPNDIRLETSTTTLPLTASAISAAICGALAKGVARTTMSAAAAASAFEVATRARLAVATAPASSGSREATTTVWPALTNEVARARPTLPAPMMAMFTM